MSFGYGAVVLERGGEVIIRTQEYLEWCQRCLKQAMRVREEISQGADEKLIRQVNQSVSFWELKVKEVS